MHTNKAQQASAFLRSRLIPADLSRLLAMDHLPLAVSRQIAEDIRRDEAVERFEERFPDATRIKNLAL